jgi:hypothetical protein
MDASVTTLTLADGSSFPDPAVPGNKTYTVILAYGTDREEVCTVTGKPTATTFNVIRHEDGSSPSPKNAGDIVVHGVSARDFTDRVTSDDPRLSDARTPLAHAGSHGTGGTDKVTPAAIGAAAAIHAANHFFGGSDPISPASIGAATQGDIDLSVGNATTPITFTPALQAGWATALGSPVRLSYTQSGAMLMGIVSYVGGTPPTPGFTPVVLFPAGTIPLAARPTYLAQGVTVGVDVTTAQITTTPWATMQTDGSVLLYFLADSVVTPNTAILIALNWVV